MITESFNRVILAELAKYNDPTSLGTRRHHSIREGSFFYYDAVSIYDGTDKALEDYFLKRMKEVQHNYQENELFRVLSRVAEEKGEYS